MQLALFLRSIAYSGLVPELVPKLLWLGSFHITTMRLHVVLLLPDKPPREPGAAATVSAAQKLTCGELLLQVAIHTKHFQ